MQQQDRLQYLLDRLIAHDATEAELQELESIVKADLSGKCVQQVETLLSQFSIEIPSFNEEHWQGVASTILSADKIKETPAVVVHRVHFLKRGWPKYAAAIIILFGISAYLWNQNRQTQPDQVAIVDPVPVQNDVAPGGNRAILTLADGSKIVLDSVKSGELAHEENATISKTVDGKIVYNSNGKVGDRILFNTIATPRGGQYQLILPDGTQVWLNAQSSITYPTAFNGRERKVSIMGEAYFEVTKNKSKPFVVDIGEANIVVLGTHFNVNTYKDEKSKNITLFEGSVRITKKSTLTTLTLKPGQQGQLTDQKLALASHVDLVQALAWKNGVFDFNQLTLSEVMKQLSRWYDVEVIYEKTIPKMTFGGKMGRDLNLSQVLEALTTMGVKFRIEGRKLIVTS